MQISRELDYALRAILALTVESGHVVSKASVSKNYDIPVNFLAIIFPKLVKGNIVKSIAGPKGGYQLSRPSCEITILDVIKAVNDGLIMNKCFEPNYECRFIEDCKIRKHIGKVQNQVEEYFGNVTFDTLKSTDDLEALR